MPKSKPLTDQSGQVRELTLKDLKAFEPGLVLPPSLQRKLGVRGPQKTPTKERVTIRLSREVIAQFRASGDGWQTRVDAALQDWLKRHKSIA